MPRIVFSRARQGQDPGAVGKANGELGVAVKLDVLSTMARNSENLSMSSWDCRREGESRTMVLRGLWMASHRARIAVMVDLPDCLEQFRIIL